MHDHVANIPPDVTTNDIERMQEEPASNAGTCGNFMQQHLSTEHEEELFAVAVRGINEPAETSTLDQVLWGGAQLQQIPAHSIPHSCEEARSGGKPTPVAPSPLRRKAHSGRTKPTLVALFDVKPTPVAPPTLHLCKSYP